MEWFTVRWHRRQHQPAACLQRKRAVGRPQVRLLWGRRHLQGVPYVLPKDEPETYRLNFQHHLLYTLRKRLWEAPLEKIGIREILDVGTGTGIWAHEMARCFPSAHVVGFDIDPPPVSLQQPPANSTFVQGNILEGLPFADGRFSYIHQRLMVAAIPALQWPEVIGELVRVVCAGGYVEVLETGDAYLQTGPAMQQLLTWSRTLGRLRGIDASLMPQLGTWLRQAGLVSVVEHVLRVPLGPWGGRVGAMMAKDTLSAFASMQALYCTSLSLAPEQFAATIGALEREWNQYRTQAQFFLAYGQRPLSGAVSMQ